MGRRRSWPRGIRFSRLRPELALSVDLSRTSLRQPQNVPCAMAPRWLPSRHADPRPPPPLLRRPRLSHPGPRRQLGATFPPHRHCRLAIEQLRPRATTARSNRTTCRRSLRPLVARRPTMRPWFKPTFSTSYLIVAVAWWRSAFPAPRRSPASGKFRRSGYRGTSPRRFAISMCCAFRAPRYASGRRNGLRSCGRRKGKSQRVGTANCRGGRR